jgi:hypothetical protein
MEPRPERRPGDDILDRYVPHLTGVDRELARERLQGLAKIMLTIAMRKVDEDIQEQDSHESDSCGRIQSTP